MKTRLVMDSGREYVLSAQPSEIVNLLTNSMGIVINGFVRFNGISINPSHVSSIEEVEE